MSIFARLKKKKSKRKTMSIGRIASGRSQRESKGKDSTLRRSKSRRSTSSRSVMDRAWNTSPTKNSRGTKRTWKGKMKALRSAVLNHLAEDDPATYGRVRRNSFDSPSDTGENDGLHLRRTNTTRKASGIALQDKQRDVEAWDV